MLLHEVTLKLNLTNSNDGQGWSWKRAAAQRNSIRHYFRQHELQRQPFELPVSIQVTRIIGPRQRHWDADSILRGSMCKALIDTMVEFGWLHDDKREWVQQVVGKQEVDRISGPAVRIEIYDKPAQFLP